MSKPKKVEKSLEGKSSTKKKATKQKLSNLSKNNVEIEEMKNVVIEDEKWQCSIVLLVAQTHSLYDFLLQIFTNLPENFTVLTKDAIANKKGNKSPNKSRKGSNTRTSIRSTSKSSEQSSKSKTTKSKNKSKKEVEETKYFRTSNDEVNSFKVCLSLKEVIIGLRNTDMANYDENITNSKSNIQGSKMKNKDMRKTGSGDETVTEENLSNNENMFHRFILLLGFYDPLLPELLSKLNISMKAIINVRNIIGKNIDTHSNERLSTATAKSRRKSSRKSKKGSVDGKERKEYSVFLENILSFSCNAEFLETCKGVTFLNYTVKNGSAKTKEIGLKHKSGMLDIFYKIKEAWNKYKKYIDTIHVQNIPTENENSKLDDAKIYSTMISMVPLESTNAAVILHCIVEQIAWWNDDKSFGKETDSFLNHNSTLSNCASASKSLSTNKTPILIHHRDEIKYNTFHLDLPEFDFEAITSNICMKSPVYMLWERYPPHPKPVRKWFEFQLQKLQDLSNNYVLKLDRLFPIYLHNLLIDILVVKTNQFTNSSDDTTSPVEEIKKVHETFLSGKEVEVCDSNSNLFIKEIMYNILCKVPNFSMCQNYVEVFEVVPYFSAETTQCTVKQPAYTNRLRNNSSKELPCETLLQKRELCKQEKLNKLVSFLNCSEFVNLYEDLSKLNCWETKRLMKYEFIEILNKQTLCQCLQLASQAFININYDYFPVTDSILLWFNNSMQDRVLSTCTAKGVLETPLCFRDFYCHKLRESTDFGDIFEGGVANRKSLEENGDSFGDELKPDLVGLESQSDYHSKLHNENHFKLASNPTIVYSLGPTWMESTESCNNYFSEDSSSVTVKRANHFKSKAHIVVNVNKNNTCLRYELDPESSNHFLQLSVDVNKTLNLNCVLQWDIGPKKSFIPRNNNEVFNNFETGENTKLKLNCSLSITLPSGLFIEVVPTNSVFGPFYVRQRYLGKGPNCSSIWDETYRCYFNNGMVLIFRVDGSIDILYNNGTIVKCHALELIKPDNVPDTKGKESGKNNKISKKAVRNDFNQEGQHRTKAGPKNQQKKKSNVKAVPKKSRSESYGKEVNNQSQHKKGKVKKEPTALENEEKLSSVKETEDNIPSYKVVQHTVLSWDGKYSQYNTESCTDMAKECLSLRTAFDIINHELYWQRSDGMSGLQAPGYFTLSFPDGSETTSFTIDNKELLVENDYVVVYRTSGDLVKVEPFIVSHNTNKEGVELNKSNLDSNHDKHLLAKDTFSVDSLDTDSLEQKCFVYIENSFLMEHTNYTSVEYSNEECELKLNLPANCWVVVDESGRFSFKGEKSESITLFGDSLLFEANVLSSSSLSKSSTNFRFENVSTIPIIFSQTEDSFGNVFSVDERGNTTYLPSVSVENCDQPRSSLYSARFPQNIERFFVFNRDLTGYEMIHEVEQSSTLSNQNMKTVSTPLVKDDGELYSLYMQSPIYRSKCEEYIMHDFEVVTPSLIKRKDLLKANKTPETIWFYPKISSVEKPIDKSELSTAQTEKTLKAMMIVQRLKVKKERLHVVSLFSELLTKYMETNEQIFQKYLNYSPKEALKEENLIECEKNRMNFLGSNSYYLTDNLPVVITREMDKGNKSKTDIFSIFSPLESKVSL